MNSVRILAAIAAFLALVTSAVAQNQFTFTPSPGSTAASPIVLNAGQNYPSVVAFTITFDIAGGTISRTEVSGILPPGLTVAGATREGDILVLTSRPSGVIQGTPTTPGDYVVNVVGVSQNFLRSNAQGNLWQIFFRIVGSSTAPLITSQPASQTVTAGANVTFTAAASGTPAPTFQWRKDGVVLSGATSAALTLTNVTSANAGSYSAVATNSLGSATSSSALLIVNPAPPLDVAPAITAQPQSVTAVAGSTVALAVVATGTPAPTYQWRKDAVALPGATDATLVLPSVTATNAGTYTVVVTNSVGSATSSSALLIVNPAPPIDVAPAITAQPQSVTAVAGSTVALAVVATGTPAPTYQWRKDAVALPGATDSTLVLPSVTATNAGTYTVVATNSVGSATSNPGTLTVGAGEGRLVNLSVRANLAAAQTLIVGFSTNGAKTVLLRGIGPTLAAFGVPGTYADPRLELYNGVSVKINENDDWPATLGPAFAAVGAFPLTSGSKDAALQTSISGTHSAHLNGPNSGVVLVEVYDAGAGNAVRLVNVSARNVVGTGDNVMIAGFVVNGTIAKTLLIRAVGPTLAAFGVTGTLVDPKLEIYNSSTAKIVENDNWSATLSATFGSVGAFGLGANSRDAALLVTLMPGSYSALVSGVANGTGEALVEVYEVP